MLWWVVVIGAFLAFLVAWGLGANDIATAFGPSVGSKALTLGQAIVLAFLVECAGAIITGRDVVDLYHKSGMRDGVFDKEPLDLMLGMCSTLAGTLVYLIINTSLALPISTAHAIVGGIVGFTVMGKGMEGVEWQRVGRIMLSTITSPLLAAAISLLMFSLIRLCILRRENSLKHGFRALPFFYGITIAFLCYFFVYRASPGLGWDSDYTSFTILGVCGVIGFGALFVVWLLGVPLLWQWIDNKYDEHGEKRQPRRLTQDIHEELQASDEGLSRALIICCMRIPFFRDYVVSKVLSVKTAFPNAPQMKAMRGAVDSSSADEDEESSLDSEDDTLSSRPEFFKKPMFLDQHPSFKSIPGMDSEEPSARSTDDNESGEVPERWPLKERSRENSGSLYAPSELYDARTEDLFSFLQILSASVSGFAHGSIDISSASAPFVIILALYNDLERGGVGLIDQEPPLPWWILGVGAVAIFFGLLIWGYRIMHNIGNNCTMITPSRGFHIDFCSSVAAVIGSKFLLLHMNSTYCIVGAVFGVGLSDGIKALNWRLLLRMWLAWICTVPFCGMISAVAFIALQYTFGQEKPHNGFIY